MRWHQEASTEFFTKIGLPVPDTSETYCASNHRDVYFLTDFGLVISFTDERDTVKGENPHFLKPLFKRKFNDVCVTIDPGIQCPVSVEESRSITAMMKSRYGITINDDKPHNFGFLPGTLFPIVIDLDPLTIKVPENAATTLAEAVQAVKRILLSEESPQETLYAPLRKMMKEAWPARADSPDLKKIKLFLNACADFKRAGSLATPWEEEENNYEARKGLGTTETARAYTNTLHAVGIVPGIK